MGEKSIARKGKRKREKERSRNRDRGGLRKRNIK